MEFRRSFITTTVRDESQEVTFLRLMPRTTWGDTELAKFTLLAILGAVPPVLWFSKADPPVSLGDEGCN